MGVSRRKRRRPEGYFRVAGLDLEEEMRRLCALPIFGGPDGPLARSKPTLNVRRASARPRRNLGFAVPDERRISVTAYPGIRAGDALEVLLHELVHLAVGRRDRSWHGRLFGVPSARRCTRPTGSALRPSAAPYTGPMRTPWNAAFENVEA